MTLKTKKFPRLLAREEYPFDQQHKKNEGSLKQSKQDKEILFRVNKNSFMADKHKVGEPLENNFNEESMYNEMIMEFLPDKFKVPMPDEKLKYDKNISIDDSD